MEEGSESTPLIGEDSSNEVSEQSGFDGLEHDSPTAECSKGDSSTGGAATVGGEVNIDKVESSSDDEVRNELVVEDDETETETGETSQEDSEQPSRIKFERSSPPRYAGDLARVAAYTSRSAASSCRYMMVAARDTLKDRRRLLDESLEKAEEVSDSDAAARFRDLAVEYDAAIRLVARKAHKVEVAAESAENASMEAEIAANQMAEISDKDSPEAEEKRLAAYWAASNANMAAIVAYKIEYAAVKSMKRCLQDLGLGSLETDRSMYAPDEEPGCTGYRQEMAMMFFCNVALLVFGILLLTTVLVHVDGKESPITLIIIVTVGTVMIATPMVYFLYKVSVFFRNKRREARRRVNRNIITRIDKRLRELEEYFEKHKISPAQSEVDDEEQ